MRVLIVAMILIIVSACNVGEKQVNQDQPNVLILFADQHHKGVMGFEGHPDVITPNLDKLANEGVVFNRAYCATGICAPSRAAMLTGINSRTL
ncbi:MAG: sulfatase-like hydrolase/transferase, partial [Eudoraea sp.]|nr:sulfatase-like hydrolase/transferase [Eudoraea sp.]